jgi:AcrR family transcriptional regulator
MRQTPVFDRAGVPFRGGMEVEAEGSAPERLSARERILETAYELFSRHGTRAVGVDRIIAECGIAKMTLYRNFPSKDELILAFLERRDERWSRAWLQAEAQRRGKTPPEQLLAIFDTFESWFARKDFEGCSFINVMLEVTDCDSPVRQATVRHLADIRAFVAGLAGEAGIEDTDAFARQWHILMKGSIVSAAEGDAQAASRAKQLGALLLEHHGVATA